MDGTAGRAGHSKLIAQKLDAESGGKFIAFDRDPEAVEVAAERLSGLLLRKLFRRIILRWIRFLNLWELIRLMEYFLDLGVSSYQLDNGDRGFFLSSGCTA